MEIVGTIRVWPMYWEGFSDGLGLADYGSTIEDTITIECEHLEEGELELIWTEEPPEPDGAPVVVHLEMGGEPQMMTEDQTRTLRKMGWVFGEMLTLRIKEALRALA